MRLIRSAILFSMAISIAVTSVTGATEYGFRASNGVLYYDEDDRCGPGSNNSSSLSGGADLSNVYIVGDSITVGGLRNGDYVEKLKSAGAKEVRIVGSGGGRLDAPGTDGWLVETDGTPKSHPNKPGFDYMREDKDFIKDATTVVIAHGTNGMPGGADDIQKAIDIIKNDAESNAKIYWVDIAITDGSGSGTPGTGPGTYHDISRNLNKVIHGNTSKGYSVISWAKAVDSDFDPNKSEPAKDANNMLGDGIHPADYNKYTDVIVDQLKGSGNTDTPSDNSATPVAAGEENRVVMTNGFTAGKNGRKRIIVHWTGANSLDKALEYRRNTGDGYHILIDKDGKETRTAEDEQIAWGAADSNKDSLHVSMVSDGSEKFDPESPQVRALSARIGKWAKQYDIPLKKISGPGVLDSGDEKGVLGHLDVQNASPGSYPNKDHPDPGEDFPWDEVLKNAGGDTSASDDSSDACCASTGNKGGSIINASVGGGGGCGEDKDGDQGNKDQIWSFLINKFEEEGYNRDEAEKAASGVMGNMWQETGGSFNPHIDHGMGCNSGPAIGLNQWCFERQTNLKNFGEEKGNGWQCLGTQLEFLWGEMTSTHKHLFDVMKGKPPREAAEIFDHGGDGASQGITGFEESWDSQQGMHVRAGFADQIYQEFTGKDPSALSSNSGANCATKSNTGAPNGSIAEVAEEMASWAKEAGGTCYASEGHGTPTEDIKRRVENHFRGVENGVDCSSFVRAVMVTATGKDPGENGARSNTTTGICDSPWYKEISENEAGPGDVIVTGAGCSSHAAVIIKDEGNGVFTTADSQSPGCGPDGFGPNVVEGSPGSWNNGQHPRKIFRFVENTQV